MKFLIHLDDDYDSIRGQILPMEPLPTVNKAYLMIQRIKKQKQITGNASVTREIVANVSRPGANDSSSHDSLNALLAKNSQKGRKDFKKNNKGNRFCDHCQRSGHTQDQCFQLIGYSVWYEGPKERGKLKKPSKMAANVMTYEDHDTPLDEGSSSGFNGGGHFDGNMLKALSQEMMKMMKGSPTVIQQSEGTQSYAHFAGLTGAKPARFPLPKGLKLCTDLGPLMPKPDTYRRLVGRLFYLTLTRPDISYAVQHLSQFLQEPREPHFQAALHVLKYLKGTASKGLYYSATSSPKLTAYRDADWGSCRVTTRSPTGYCIFFGSSLVSWKTKKQKTVAKSFAEAEYRAMSVTTSEFQWLAYLLKDLHIDVPLPITCTVTTRQPCILQRTLFFM